MLYFATEDWRSAIEMINRWSSLTSAPTSQAYELLAEAHYQLKEYRKAIPPIRKTIELKRAKGQPVDERSYLLLRSAYRSLREYDQVAAVREELIRHFPGDKYWIQLAGTYGEAGEGREQLSPILFKAETTCAGPENPCVGGSILPGTTNLECAHQFRPCVLA